MKMFLAAGGFMLAASIVGASPLTCSLGDYKAIPGLTAAIEQDMLAVTWNGEAGAELRIRIALDGGRPVVRDLAIRRRGAPWAMLGRNLAPEFAVVSGVRRVAFSQLQPLERELGLDVSKPEVTDPQRWTAFWDAPLNVPGVTAGRNPQNPGLPRTPDEIKQATATFNTTSCSVKTDGTRLEVTLPGLSMGIFAGSLRFTVYEGTNLVRMEAVAKTDQNWVAYKYDGGLTGFTTDLMPRVAWHDTSNHPQQYQFGGVKNESRVPVRAANRVLLAEGKAGSVATFPPPHTFFFTREVDTNLGYVWYRKDGDARFSIGIRQAEAEDVEQYKENFALYNAPPGTWQRMAVYFYASPAAAESARQSVMAFTHDDIFKPLPGYKTFVNHFHLAFTDRLRASGSFDTPLQDLAAMKELGLNIIGLSDFHFELHARDSGALRFQDQKDYFEGTRRASDIDFLVVPWEEPSAYFGGHYNIMWPKRVYWSKVRTEGQSLTENDPVFGKVYHTGNAAEVQQMMDAEGAYWYHAHPRTKSTAGYPEAVFDKPFAKNDKYLGVAFKPGMGMDLSEQRLCDWRCFDATDTMNNLYANTGLRPKYIIADIDTYKKGPEDDLYANFPVNYLKLDRLPGPDDDWSPILKSLREGTFFVTTGEVLIKSYAIDGTGSHRTITADAEWTFPLEFVEVVWGDGKKTDRQIIRATDLGAFGTKRFSIPFDATGKAWVRFAIWDSAGNGGFVQPIWLNAQTTTTQSGQGAVKRE